VGAEASRRQPFGVVSEDLISGTVIEHGEPSESEGVVENAFTSRTARSSMHSLESLSEGHSDRLGEALAGSGNQLAGQLVGFVVLDAERHV
jgi:hypothetical protein